MTTTSRTKIYLSMAGMILAASLALPAAAQTQVMAPCQVLGAEPGDTYAKITQIHTITGGTGRFAGVQGSFTLTLYHDVRLSSDGTHHTCGSYGGTVTPPGAAH